MKINNFLKLIIAVGVSEMAGVIGAVFTTPAVLSEWYAGLTKPAINPPALVFGPVWTLLYALMGVSAWLIWKELDSRFRGNDKERGGNDKEGNDNDKKGSGNDKKIKVALGIFLGQLTLNTLWSIIFFGSTSLTINGLNNIGIAFIEIVFLWLAILATIFSFVKISRLAAWLLLPYILWVSFAAYLNYSIWMLN